MIQLYYENFHPSHPFMVPRRALGTSLGFLIPPQLLSVMRYIGAHYYPDPALKQAFRQAAFDAPSDQSIEAGFKVQALLLLAITDHCHCHEQSSHRLIQTAVNLALETGMNRRRFASEHSYGHSVLEESWRRTYWELYVVDGLLAAMREQSSFRLYHQPANVQLPCDEKMYKSDEVRLNKPGTKGRKIDTDYIGVTIRADPGKSPEQLVIRAGLFNIRISYQCHAEARGRSWAQPITRRRCRVPYRDHRCSPRLFTYGSPASPRRKLRQLLSRRDDFPSPNDPILVSQSFPH